MPETFLARLFPWSRKAARKPSRRPVRRLRVEYLEGRQLLSGGALAAVYTQPAAASGGVMKSAWYPPDGLDGDQYVYDNFTLGSAAAIKEIDWKGGYTNFLSGAGKSPVFDFTISIYPSIAAGIQPDIIAGPIVQYSVGGNAGETPDGASGNIPLYDYKYTLPTPFQAEAGKQYWVQIEASQGVTPFYYWPPDWGLALATGGDSSHFRAITGGTNGGGTLYAKYSGDAAFALLADGGTQAMPTIEVSGGPFAYDATAHEATAVALAADGVTPVSGTFSLGYFQNGVAVSPINAGSYDVIANFTSSDPAYASTSSVGSITINKIAASFTKLAAPTIVAGTTSTLITGHLGNGAVPQVGGFVGVTLAGTNNVAQVGPYGDFSVSVSTGSLAAGSYPLGFSFNGDVNFNAASGQSTLVVGAQASAPVVTLDPVDQTVVAGKVVAFTAAATAVPSATVQWQVSKDGGLTFGDIPGATDTTFTFGTEFKQNGRLYRAVFTNSAGTVASQPATLHVRKRSPRVTLNPVSQSATVGQLVTFTAAAVGRPMPTIQWQVSMDHGRTFADIAGATGPSYSFGAKAKQNGRMYRAVFVNDYGIAYSDAVTLTVV